MIVGTPAHKQAVQAIQAEQSDLPVGLTIAMQDMQAVEGGEAVRDRVRHELQDVFLDAAREDDFVGVQGNLCLEEFYPGARTHFVPDGNAVQPVL